MTTRLKLIERSECPPDKFRYTFRETGYTVRCFDKNGWLAQIRQHAKDNGFEPPTQAEAEDQLCRLLPPGWCQYEDGEPPKWFLEARLKPDDVINGTKALAALVASWVSSKLFGTEKPVVSKELAESRADTCSKCYMNVPIPGCAPCVGISNTIAEIAGGITTAADQFLKVCLVCKCSNEAQTRVRIDILANGVPDEMIERFPDFCWKKQELLNYSNA